ncbi:hydrocephalus-inducing protein homolog [Myripristis murdjan]|uniref:hydrocephalus-inducing protein homolog n=1 Tax=Myripristis murdjan TaxID=586833 RepID=UPI0011760C01|nr:hydrocephalus-inducing protein homolog [Myripristis murdjan]
MATTAKPIKRLVWKLDQNKDRPRKVTPSSYAKEMLQTTEERLANTKEVHPPRIVEQFDISETTYHKHSCVEMDKPLFQAYPSELVFQSFTPPQTYTLPLRLYNIDKVCKCMGKYNNNTGTELMFLSRMILEKWNSGKCWYL